MKRLNLIIITFIIVVFSQHINAQTEIQNDASRLACNCIDSLTINSISERDSIVNCFYIATSEAINNKYFKNGKLRLSGKKFYILSGDLLFYLQVILYMECSSYKNQIDSGIAKIKFK